MHISTHRHCAQQESWKERDILLGGTGILCGVALLEDLDGGVALDVELVGEVALGIGIEQSELDGANVILEGKVGLAVLGLEVLAMAAPGVHAAGANG